MLRRTFLGLTTALVAVVASGTVAMAEAKTYYWISHGSPADPVWTYFLDGANNMGGGYRQHGEHVVPFGRRAQPSRGSARGDCVRRGWDRDIEPRSGVAG